MKCLRELDYRVVGYHEIPAEEMPYKPVGVSRLNRGITMLITIIVAVLLACVAGAGIGGGGLLTVYLTLALDMGQIQAQALNLAAFVLSALSSSVMQYKNRTMPDLKLILLCSGSAIPGVLIGTGIRDNIPSGLLRLVFGVVLTVAGFAVLISDVKKSLLLSATKRKIR